MSGSAILDKIKAARAAQGTSSTPVAPTAVVSTSPEAAKPATVAEGQTQTVVNQANQQASAIVAKGPVSGLMAKIQTMGKGQPTLTGQVAASFQKETGTTAAPSGELAKTTVATLGELVKLASGVVPPDAPARTQPVITKPGDQVADPLKIEEEESEEDGEGDVGSDTSVPATPSVSVDTPSTSVSSGVSPGEPVKRRGRPSNAELEARKAEEQKKFDDAVAAAVAVKIAQMADHVPIGIDAEAQLKRLEGEIAELSQELEAMGNTNRKLLEENSNLLKDRNYYKTLSDTSAVGISATKEGFTLFVDCFPTKGEPPTDFFEWIGPICAAVAQQNNVGDWRQINYTAKGLLANAIRETVKAEGLPKAMVVSSYAGGADIALEILTPLAKRVIKKL